MARDHSPSAINHVEHSLPTLSGLNYYAQAAAICDKRFLVNG